MKDVLVVKRLARPAVPHFANALSITRMILTDALEDCARQLSLEGTKAAVDHLRRGDRTATGHFERRLARSIGEYLASWDGSLRAVYHYEHEPASEDTRVGTTVLDPLHLIVWAEPKTAALHSLLAMLDRALAQALGELHGMPAPARVLDVQLLDDAEIQGRLGYAAILFSAHHRPALVWGRKELTSD